MGGLGPSYAQLCESNVFDIPTPCIKFQCSLKIREKYGFHDTTSTTHFQSYNTLFPKPRMTVFHQILIVYNSITSPKGLTHNRYMRGGRNTKIT